jgi:hypothetical protein
MRLAPQVRFSVAIRLMSAIVFAAHQAAGRALLSCWLLTPATRSPT